MAKTAKIIMGLATAWNMAVAGDTINTYAKTEGTKLTQKSYEQNSVLLSSANHALGYVHNALETTDSTAGKLAIGLTSVIAIQGTVLASAPGAIFGEFVGKRMYPNNRITAEFTPNI